MIVSVWSLCFVGFFVFVFLCGVVVTFYYKIKRQKFVKNIKIGHIYCYYDFENDKCSLVKIILKKEKKEYTVLRFDNNRVCNVKVDTLYPM